MTRFLVILCIVATNCTSLFGQGLALNFDDVHYSAGPVVLNPDEEFQDTNIYNYGDDQLLVYGKIKVSNHYFEATTVKFQVKWDGDEEWTTVQEEVGLPADGSPVDVDVASIDRVGETNGVCPDQRVFSVRFVVVENGNDVDEHQENVVTFVKNPSETSGGSNEDEPGDEAPLPPS